MARFEIPARSVRQILSDMKKERGVKPLHTLADLDDVDAIDAQPWRAFRIAKRVFDRAEAKPDPTLRDLEQLEGALRVLALAKRALRAAPLRNRSVTHQAGDLRTEQREETTLERIAREIAAEEAKRASESGSSGGEGEDILSHTYTPGEPLAPLE